MKYIYFIGIMSILLSCMTPTSSNNNRIYVCRFGPDKDLKQEIMAFAKEHHIRAGYIVTCVGSLKKLTLRLANQPGTISLDDKFEIVSLVGTFADTSGAHLHLSVSDSTGKTIGGHLMDGNVIYTTAEMVFGEAMDVQFKREPDPQTTYKELKIEKK